MAEPFLSEIRIFSFNLAPKGWASCNGQLLPINQNQALFSLLGTTYGGNGQTTFALPDLRGRVPFHFDNSFSLGQVSGEENHTLNVNEIPLHGHTLTPALNAVVGGSANATQTSPVGNFWANSGKTCYTTAPANALMGNGTVSATGGQAHNNMSPFLTLNFCIALTGIFPLKELERKLNMADPFVAEIRIFPFNFAPTGWAMCNGQLLPISQNTALFSLLGTFYGGDGKSTFALPNLQGQAAMNQGQGPGLSDRFLGEASGVDSVTLLSTEMASHSHTFGGSVAANGAALTPVGNLWAQAPQGRGSLTIYHEAPATGAVNPNCMPDVGGMSRTITYSRY